MILLFHALMYAINELSTPVWHNEVRHITYQVVEAMREAETFSRHSEFASEVVGPFF